MAMLTNISVKSARRSTASDAKQVRRAVAEVVKASGPEGLTVRQVRREVKERIPSHRADLDMVIDQLDSLGVVRVEQGRVRPARPAAE